MLNRLRIFALLVCLLTSLSLFAQRTWTGTVNANWSQPGNWFPAGTPQPSDALSFQNGAANRDMINDLPPGTAVGSMEFSTDPYTLTGNLLTLNGGVTRCTCDVDLKLGASVSFDRVQTNGALDINGQTLTTFSSTFDGPVNGTGTIISTAMIESSSNLNGIGNFSGTIHGVPSGGGVTLAGSCALPDATLALEFVVQHGNTASIGDLTITPSALGYVSAGQGGNAGAPPGGVLHTKSLTLSPAAFSGGFGGGLAVFMYPTTSSQIDVTGTVTLNGATLGIVVDGAVPIGQSFTIIKNDGIDPVNGTFAGLSEGAVIGSKFTISYHGGDGNDVVVTRAALSVKTWTGGVNGNWSNASNWSPAAPPVPGELLIFQEGAPNRNTINDLPPGTSVGAMTFNDAYTVSGNLLTLMGDVNGLSSTADLKLGAPVAFSGISNGAIDINGQTLTIQQSTFNGAVNGTGTIISTAMFGGSSSLNGGGNFSGTIQGRPSGGGLSLGASCALPAATVAIESVLQGGNTATLGDLTITPSSSGYVSPGPGGNAGAPPGGVLHTRSLTLSPAVSNGPGGGFVVFVYPTTSSQIDVTGTVTLNGASLGIVVEGGVPTIGQSFTIIKNDGTDPVSGTFAGSPEGAIVGSSHLRISYVGGDGNDVVLTALYDTTTAISQDTSATQFGEPMTLTATVSAQSGTPVGSVSFTADGASIGTAPVQNGVAVLSITTLHPGTHTFVATFSGSGVFAASVSGSIAHNVARGQTNTNIAANQTNTTYGQTARFTVTVSAHAPAAGQPSGSVVIFADSVSLGTATIVNGTAIFETSALYAGVKSMTATYAGDPNFAVSTSSAIQQNVRKAQTEVDTRTRTVFVGESPLITVFVNVTPGSSLAPTGSVTLSEGGAVVGVHALAGGAAIFSLSPLAAGDHTFVVNYSGDIDFEASSATILQSVLAPSLSIHGTRVIEGNQGMITLSLSVSLSAPVSQPVRVSFSTVAGSAIEVEDYERASGVIEFAPGELTRSIELHIVGDTFPESDESFSVLLSNPINATIDAASAVIVIANDDQVPPRHRPSRH
jgi:hypothetical protein